MCTFYILGSIKFKNVILSLYVIQNVIFAALFYSAGAPAGKRVILFVDDLNMPKLDRYGSQPPVELLRQYQDFRGLYDREKLFWKKIQDMTICAACAPPGGGRNPVTPRMIRHFSMFCFPNPSDLSLRGIFTVSVFLFFLWVGMFCLNYFVDCHMK